MKFLCTITLLLCINLAYSQDVKSDSLTKEIPPTFTASQYEKSDSLTNQAHAAYKAGEYEKSIALYAAGFDVIGGMAYPFHRYNAACAYALAGDSSNAFYHLFSLANGGAKYKSLSHISIDPDLGSLHVSTRWENLMAIVAANKYEAEKDLNQELIALLDTVLIEDQKYRMQIGGIKEEFGWDSDEMRAHLADMKKQDSVNLIIVCSILDEHGWLGTNVVGYDGNGALFLVIQHAETEVQVKYLPMMRAAAKNGNAYLSDLALLEDRVALALGNKQIYGSQIGYDEVTDESFVLPIEDPENVDIKRAEVGLNPLADYVKSWGIVWDLEEHIAQQK